MEFVDLKRRFAVIGQDDESNLEVGRFWGSEIAGWLRRNRGRTTNKLWDGVTRSRSVAPESLVMAGVKARSRAGDGGYGMGSAKRSESVGDRRTTAVSAMVHWAASWTTATTKSVVAMPRISAARLGTTRRSAPIGVSRWVMDGAGRRWVVRLGMI
jgi:hypothetical protein